MKFLLIIVIFALNACGFTPVYSPSMQTGAVENSMSAISVDIIPNREGQMVRNYLLDRISLNGAPASPEYRLSVSPIVENIVEIGIDIDDEASRAQVRESAQIQLIRLSDNTVVLTRTVRSVSSYNILSGQFTTFVTEQDAREQALRALAENIVTDLELYFNR